MKINTKILIADSGSTTTDWIISANGNVELRFKTAGINPIYQDAESIAEMLNNSFPKFEFGDITQVHFYGAGCIGGDVNEVIINALQTILPNAEIEVNSDLLGAARALCQHEAGVACILGTGSNSGLYDGKEITANVRPLGFILGDEGSGANIGKRIVADALKGILPTQLSENLLVWCGLQYSEIIDKIYRQPYPNRFLASFARFASENISHIEIQRIVSESFDDFVTRNLLQYNDIDRIPIHFVGSVAANFNEILKSVFAKRNLNLGKIVQSPIDELAKFHADE